MANKKCLIRQPAGLGDIFFLQKAADEVHKRGYDIIWPVIDNFLYITEYIRTPYITFYSEEEDFPFKQLYNTNSSVIVENEDVLYIPFQHADRSYPAALIMDSKYNFINLDYSNWQNYFNFRRDRRREDILYSNVLELRDGEEYVLVNKNFGSPPNSKKVTNINVKENMKIVEMDFYGLENVFDWCKVIENAKLIYTVDTSICYMMEKLNLSAENINLYCRFKKEHREHNYLNNILVKTKYSLLEAIY